MATYKRSLRLVVASPGDVQPERDLLKEVVAELNRGIAAERGLHLEVSRWETDAYPGLHDAGPQGLIDSVLRIEDCGLLIGIFWKRFGTPVLDAQSGTEHELLTAYEAWKRNGRPQVMVYFNQKPYTPKTRAEIEQWGQVLDFKNTFPEKGLWWTYNGKRQFANLVRNHLTQFIRRLSVTDSPSARPESPPDSKTTAPSASTTRNIIALPPQPTPKPSSSARKPSSKSTRC